MLRQRQALCWLQQVSAASRTPKDEVRCSLGDEPLFHNEFDIGESFSAELDGLIEAVLASCRATFLLKVPRNLSSAQEALSP